MSTSYKPVLKTHSESKSNEIKTLKTVQFTSDTKTEDARFNKSTTKTLPFMTKNELIYRYYRSKNAKLNNEYLKTLDTPDAQNMYIDVEEEFKDRDSKNLAAQVADVHHYLECNNYLYKKISQQALVDTINALMMIKHGYESVEEAIEAGCVLAKLVVDAEKVAVKQQKPINNFRRRRQIRRYNKLCVRESEAERQAAAKAKLQCKVKRENSIHKKKDFTLKVAMNAAKKEQEENEFARRKKEQEEEAAKKQNKQSWGWFGVSGFLKTRKLSTLNRHHEACQDK
ncbi:unnamed protein product [Ambrosiozyma monospora]|uniref:Unnamed protein product n=1 Tax=Ambrosiozyma monospora TaxID=43982 RepID=A0ACB5SS04_AMBMO|nr:unnamed protein product [Ambrosiozyma monospora]